ncbi:hypothetical protein ACWE42_21030 [Sutcliffiella cohnii]|uniref:hypothetical protein n=1 Tax=Sutcliffiella TaxID=2837511 RepID=UPI000AF9699C|nr:MULTISPECIES: hypothetical protein [Sutcliffiella]MED4018359.1 hypothetical protein [Sutcliffiella cohnii]WBL15629.1 hypothetical protein O1A01_02970 [Sutcliffiella sp. NC1]
MIISRKYFLTDYERESVEQTLVDYGFHLEEDLLPLDDDQIIHLYQKVQMDQLISK